ncbi:helix-turn-helix transcriptional regulator [Streptomyces shenzhenensis]|uniref:Transcriptional regulator n=1 Tax=Streptomyces shenzhenensis TaxID=943815 RepID=A0A3M0I2K5_9ACTN|nr:helix-turn-helix transcriptional regulator [Streptomyces shenzhenensis]RMB82400.1 transcriptional regulator [Streptomyces shenzhenensis]
MDDSNLGDFLRTRRALTMPEDVARKWSGHRRVPGLRREEVSVLAGVSVDYYTRLEQGRERHPSEQILDALARALELDADARDHLHRLAGRTPSARQAHREPRLRPGLTSLLDSWGTAAAYIIDRTLDVLVENDLARALHSGFDDGDNLARMTFIDPAGHDFYVDWDRAAHAAAGHLRLAAGHDPDHPRLRALVDELLDQSAEFRALWKRHDVRGKTRESKQFRHPNAGLLTLDYATFEVQGDPGLQLVVQHAPPGSPSAENWGLLRSFAASLDAPFRTPPR